MAFSSDIVIDAKTFALTQIRPTSSLRRDSASTIDEPSEMVISHEIAKSGLVSSVILMDNYKTLGCETECSLEGQAARIRSQFKISYNPTLGVDGLTTEVNEVIDQLIAFVSVPANISKLLNQEV